MTHLQGEDIMKAIQNKDAFTERQNEKIWFQAFTINIQWDMPDQEDYITDRGEQ
jgi:hypothetical protein